jgi:hypothetical protein
MPWEVKKDGDQYCVHKKGGDKIKGGCHPNRAAAVKHLKALYANVEDASMAANTVKILGRAERDKLPAHVFADPDNKLFPIQSQDDLKTQLPLISRLGESGKTLLERVTSIAKGKGWTLPAAFGAEIEDDSPFIESEPVDFEGGEDSYEEGEFVVYPQRKLFPAGWYESHNFGMTPEELSVVPFTCSMAPLDLDHHDTVIKDEFIGHGRNFTAGWEGDDWVMRGDIAVHQKLDPLLKEETKMSTTWDRGTKDLTKIALLLNPRIPDASLKDFAAFAKAKHTTNSGKTAIQNLHDHSVRGGAVCSGDNADMASKEEHKAIQAVHDSMVAAGAKCESERSPIWSYYTDPGDAGLEEDNVNLAATQNGAGSGTTPPAPAAATPPVTPAEMSDAQNPQLAALQRQIDDMAKETRRAKAQAAFNMLLGRKVITPGLQGHFEALFEQLMEDDQKATASVKFGAKDTDAGTRTEVLLAMFGAVKPHKHDQEMIPAGDRVLFEDEPDTQEKESRRSRLGKLAKEFAGVKGGK